MSVVLQLHYTYPNAKAVSILGKTHPREPSSKVTRNSGNQHLIHFNCLT